MDLFKQFNNIYGYQAGDQCLKKIAEVIADCTQGDDVRIARFGGEQFAVILPDSDTDAACSLAEKIRSQVESLQIPHTGEGNSPVVTVSVGIASLQPDKNNSFEQLITRTTQALYLAKKNGRNQVATDKNFAA
jgi:diguanylate cyclase (GGDEF)-like protein